MTHNLEELRRLAYMVDDLLFLARAESPPAGIDFQALDARGALAKAWDFFDAAAEEQGVAVVYQGRGAYTPSRNCCTARSRTCCQTPSATPRRAGP